jgi:hypothetical protein
MSILEIMSYLHEKGIDKVMIKLKEWKRSLMVISSPLSESESLAIFIDMTMEKEN